MSRRLEYTTHLDHAKSSLVRIMEYLNKINELGKASRGQLLEIARMNERNLDNQLRRLLDWKWVDEIAEDRRRFYKKTINGEEFHINILRNWNDYLYHLHKELHGDRLPPRSG